MNKCTPPAQNGTSCDHANEVLIASFMRIEFWIEVDIGRGRSCNQAAHGRLKLFRREKNVKLVPVVFCW